MAIAAGGPAAALARPRRGTPVGPVPTLKAVTLDAESKAAAARLANAIKHDIALSLAGKADADVKARGIGAVAEAYARGQGRGGESRGRRAAADLLGASKSKKQAQFGKVAAVPAAKRKPCSTRPASRSPRSPSAR